MADTREVSITVPDGIEAERIDRFLAGYEDLDLTRNRIQRLISKGELTVNGETVPKSYQVSSGEVIHLRIPPPRPRKVEPVDIPLDIRYEDEHLVVVNKPAGLVVHPAPGNRTNTLVNALVFRYGALAGGSAEERPGIVHRLDRETSGLLVIARNDKVYLKLQRMMQAREIQREYLALVCGHVTDENGTIDAPIGRAERDRTKQAVDGEKARRAVTHYSVTERFRSYDLLEIKLETGRTHQIRVHLSSIGHPVFGDPDYGGRDKWLKGMFGPERPLGKRLLDMLDRQALHAFRLTFEHPETGQEIRVESELPDDMAAVLDVLRKEGI